MAFKKIFVNVGKMYKEIMLSVGENRIFIWRDTRGKLPLARNPDKNWWLKDFLAAAHSSMDNR